MTSVKKEDDKIPPQTQKNSGDRVDDYKSIDDYHSNSQKTANDGYENDNSKNVTTRVDDVLSNDILPSNNTTVVASPNYSDIRQPENEITKEKSSTTKDLHGTRNKMKCNKNTEQERTATGTAGLHGEKVAVPNVSKDSSAIRQLAKIKTQDNALHTLSQPNIYHPQHDGTISKEEVRSGINLKQRALPPTKHSNKRENKREQRKENTIQEENTIITIDKEVVIFLLAEEKVDRTSVINLVMKYISAYLNTNGGVVKLKNHDCIKTNGKHLDMWYKVLEEKLFEESSKYITKEGEYNDEIILLHIKPLDRLFTVDMYLYFPRTTEVIEAKYTQAIGILCSNDTPGSLSDLPFVKRDFEHNKALQNLSENDQIQFKNIKNESKNFLSKFSSKIDKYISAFSNHKGGRILFGIEDKEFKVVGVKLTKENKESIRNIMHRKMHSDMKRGCTHITCKHGEHWSLEFIPIKNITDTIPDGTCLEVIMVSVCRYPGGVFTDTPKAYYVREEDRTIQQYIFQEWKTKMTFSDKDEQIEICNVDIGNIVSYYMETKALGDLTDVLNSTRHVFLKGMNGAGKSQLALKYAQGQKEQSRHSYIIWGLNCLNTDELQTALSFFNKKLGCYMHSPNFADKCQSYGHSIVSKLTTICQMHKDLSPIILLENVNVTTLENAIVFLKQLAECPPVKVIATTQINPGWSFKVLEINGFTEDESRKFLNDNETIDELENKMYLDLARKVSCNPLGLFICRTFMANYNYTIEKMNTFIDTPYKLLTMNTLVDRSEGENRLFQCLLNVLHQIKEDDQELFKLWTVLIFLDTNAGLPLLLLEFFSKQVGLADDFTVEKFVKKIKHASFGSISDKDDYRVLKTHNVIILALRLDLEATDPNDMVSKRPYLQCLLESLMMLISEDNRSPEDKRMHTLMLPHAIFVVRHAEEFLAEFESEMTDAIKFKIPLMYVNHLIGYTLSVRRRSVQATHYLTRAKRLIFSLIYEEQTEFESGQQTDHYNARENAEQLLEKSDTFLNKNRAFISNFVKWFALGKRRSEKEKESLCIMLNKPSFHGQLTEKEHMKLVKTKNALSLDDMQSLLFLELVISIFYTYGRQIFYLDDNKDKDRKMFSHYLKVAYCLSSKINDRYPNLYWQRICSRGGTIKLMFLDPVQHENIDEHWERMKELLTKEKRKEFRYYQFGILKIDERLKDQVIWLKYLVKYCILLYKIPEAENSKTQNAYLIKEGQKVVDDLKELEGDIKDLTTYYSSLLTIVEWYDCIGKHETAFEYFKRTMEDNLVKEYEINKYQERALEIYIRHLVKSCQNQKAQEVLSEYGLGIRNDKFFADMRTLMPSPIQQQDS